MKLSRWFMVSPNGETVLIRPIAGGGGGGQQVSQEAEIPEELKPLISGSVGSALGVQENLPISTFTQANPAQTASMSPLQTAALDAIPGLATVGQRPLNAAFASLATAPELYAMPIGTPGAENQALNTLGSVVGGQVGSSPATQAGMRAWQSNVLPQVENQMVQAGLGRGGDLLKAVGGSASEAFFPLIQQEIQNRMGAVPMYNQIGQQQQERGRRPIEQSANALMQAAPLLQQQGALQFDQRRQTIEAALAGGQLTQDQAQAQLDNLHNEWLRLQSLSEAATLGPLGQVLPSLIGFRGQTNRNLGLAEIIGK